MKFYRFHAEPALRIIEVVEMTSCGLKRFPFFDISNLVLSPSALLRVNSSEGTVRDLKKKDFSWYSK